MLVKYWSNTGQILVEYWSNTGQILWPLQIRAVTADKVGGHGSWAGMEAIPVVNRNWSNSTV
jgi:hypothetical protein